MPRATRCVPEGLASVIRSCNDESWMNVDDENQCRRGRSAVQSFARRGISSSTNLMSDLIHVTLEEDESLIVEPRRYDFVVDVSREAITNDLSDEHSVVRQKFKAIPGFEKFGTWGQI
jgi:hypothetical protein